MGDSWGEIWRVNGCERRVWVVVGTRECVPP